MDYIKDFLQDRDNTTFVLARRGNPYWTDLTNDDPISSSLTRNNIISEDKKISTASFDAIKHFAKYFCNIICKKPYNLQLSKSENFATPLQTMKISTKPLHSFSWGHGLDIILGEAIHEAAHLAYTDFTLSAGYDKISFFIDNVLEDERIERQICLDYPGMRAYLTRSKYYYFDHLYYPSVVTRWITPTDRKSEWVWCLELLLRFIRYPKDMPAGSLKEYEPLLQLIAKTLLPYPTLSEEIHKKTLEVRDIIQTWVELKWPLEDADSGDSDESGESSDSDNEVDESDEEGDSSGTGLGSKPSTSSKPKKGSNNPSEEKSDESTDEKADKPSEESEKESEEESESTDPIYIKGDLPTLKDMEEALEKLDKANSKKTNSQRIVLVLNPNEDPSEHLEDYETVFDSSIRENSRKNTLREEANIESNTEVDISTKVGLKKEFNNVRFSEADDNDEQYNLVKEQVQGFSHLLNIRLQDLLFKKREFKPFQKSGKLTNSSLVDGRLGREEIYERSIPKEEKKPFPIIMLIDQSGSMEGTNIAFAQKAAILIQLALENIEDLEFYCYGHNTTSKFIDIFTYYEPQTNKSFARADVKKLGSLFAGGGNIDGIAINAVFKRVRSLTDSNGVFLLLSDGAPAGPGYGGIDGLKHTQLMCAEASNGGFQVVHIAIGHMAICADKWVLCDVIENLPIQLSNVLENEIKIKEGFGSNWAD
jgi:uncharacterized protein YegL